MDILGPEKGSNTKWDIRTKLRNICAPYPDKNMLKANVIKAIKIIVTFPYQGLLYNSLSRK